MNARGMVRRAGLTLGVGLLAVSAYAQATATQKPAPSSRFTSPKSVRQERTSSGCRRRRRSSTRCSTWPR